MRAIVVEKYGPVENFVAKEVPGPGKPKNRDLLVRIEACSVNPIDTKVRAGKYDDYPDYYGQAPGPPQICGFDAAGTVVATGSECSLFKEGDQIYYSGSPIKQGSNAEFQLVDERSVALKPKLLDTVEAAALPLTYLTAYQGLIEQLRISAKEEAAILIINGGGGVGAIATQIARRLLKLPVVITTASRPSTTDFSRRMGATHVVNHREDIVKQIEDLDLHVPVRYIFIAYSTDKYMDICAKVCAPMGKVCSIVQGEAKMYGTEFMAKSLSFIWCLIGTRPVYQVDVEAHHRILTELSQLVDSGVIQCHLTQRMELTCQGIMDAHRLIEGGTGIGKIALGVHQNGCQQPFM